MIAEIVGEIFSTPISQAIRITQIPSSVMITGTMTSPTPRSAPASTSMNTYTMYQNRRYTSEEFYEKCEILRKYFEKPALTTDVIVGFPQETEEEFEPTYEFLKKICFYETHIFKYSKREGTKAAVMQGQIPEQIKAKRSARLIELGMFHNRKYRQTPAL